VPGWGLLAIALGAVIGLSAQQPPQAPPGQAPPAAPASPSDQAPPAGQQPVFRTGINFVRVDAIVTDKKGEPVTDLRATDFEVFEDGKPQSVETFRFIRLTGEPEPGAEPPRPIRTDLDEENEAQREDVRIFVFLLDDYHVRRGAGLGVKEPLIKFIRNQLGPLDLVGLMYPLSPVTDLRLTRTREALVRAIERFEGRKYDYRARNEFEERYSMYPAEVVERVRNEVSLLAIEALVTHLGSVREGRKTVILVSEGYTHYLPPQLRDPIAEMPGLGNPARGQAGVGDANEDRARLFSDMDITRMLRDIYNAANRSNTAIYALDPRGLTPFEFDINEGVGFTTDSRSLNATMDTLRVLADETDGRAIVNRNDLEGGLRQVVRDAGAYYLLGYNSTQAPTDGKFHEIKVRVKRPGVQVRARRGYWALTEEETARALAPPRPGPDPAVTKALASVETPRRARVLRTWVGTSPGEAGKTRVSVVWEPVPAVPGERRAATPARVSLLAAGSNGELFYRGKVDAVGGAPEGGAVPPAAGGRAGRVEFEAVPGRMQLRVGVEDAGGNILDSGVEDVAVPDYTAPEVQVSTPQVFRARNAVEFRTITTDPAALPTAAREFSRTERLLIRFAARGPGNEEPRTEVRLLNRTGQRMVDLQAQPAPNGEAGRFQVDLPLAGLAAGDYIVEVTSSGTSGKAQQLVGFRVTS
jgi:VWFA-related protein